MREPKGVASGRSVQRFLALVTSLVMSPAEHPATSPPSASCPTIPARFAAVDDDGLVARLRRGDGEAKRQLFEAEAERVWALAYRLTGDYDLAHDVVQEAFMRAFRKIDRFDGRGSFRAWLARLALNYLRDRLRTDRRRLLLARDSVQSRISAQAPDADPIFDQRVRRAVDQLPEGHRTVLLMHDVEGYTHDEIASALEIAPGSSRARLSRARRLMRELLADLDREALP